MMELPVVLYTITFSPLRYRDRDKRSKCAHDKKYVFRYVPFFFVLLLYKYDLKQGVAILLIICYEDKKSVQKSVNLIFSYLSPTTFL